jgi:hypothetical protein
VRLRPDNAGPSLIYAADISYLYLIYEVFFTTLSLPIQYYLVFLLYENFGLRQLVFIGAAQPRVHIIGSDPVASLRSS